MKQLFSDFFEISEDVIEDYGAFNISLVSDLPLFIDPFRIFNSTLPTYKKLHDGIIKYLVFLRDKSLSGKLNNALLKDLFTFPEVKQNWLGFSKTSNKGSGLGMNFAIALDKNFKILNKFGNESISKSHLEKVTLINDGVGKDNISDFTTNLIKEFLLNYTQTFAQNYIPKKFREIHAVEKVKFNYKTQIWEDGTFELPNYDNSVKDNYVILTPYNLLTKDENWINREDLLSRFQKIAYSVDDQILKTRITNYFQDRLSKIAPKEKNKDGSDKEPTAKHKKQAASETIEKFPEILDYFQKYKEENKKEADATSSLKVVQSKLLYLKQFSKLAQNLSDTTDFYKISTTYNGCLKKLKILKGFIEKESGNEIFHFDKKPIKDEDNLSILFRMAWKAHLTGKANLNDNAEIITTWKKSNTKLKIVLKLSSNSVLKKTLENLREAYKDSLGEQEYILVIIHYSNEELNSVKSLLKSLGMSKHKNIVFVNAGKRQEAINVNEFIEKNFDDDSDFTNKGNKFNGYGLLIGVGDDLPVTVDDATGLYNILTNPKRAAYPPENVQLLTENDTNRQGILNCLDKLIKQSKAKSIDTAIVYYSGHGGKIGNEYYLAPFDRNTSRPKETLVSGKEFSDKINSIKANKLIVILDCCRAGGIPISKDAKSFFESNPPQDLLDKLSRGSGKVIITSSHESENSLALRGRPYSAFTECLIDALSGKGTKYYDGYAKILDIISYLFREVPKQTKNRQHPFLNNATNLSENFAVCYYAGGLKNIPDGSDSQNDSAVTSIISSKFFRLQEKLEDLEANRKLLRTKVNRYRNEIAVESDLTTKIKLETKLFEAEADLTKIEADMEDIENQINGNN